MCLILYASSLRSKTQHLYIITLNSIIKNIAKNIVNIIIRITIKMATRMRVQKTNNDQYIVTIPKAFAETFDYKQGTLVEFRINENGDMVLRKVGK